MLSHFVAYTSAHVRDRLTVAPPSAAQRRMQDAKAFPQLALQKLESIDM